MGIKMENLDKVVMTSTPEELVVLTFEGLLKALDNVKESLLKRDREEYNFQIQRVLLFIDELFYSLDFSVDIAKDLGAIYFYCRNQVYKARITMDISLIDLVKKIITPISEAFYQVNEAEEKNKSIKDLNGVVAGLTYGKGSLEEVVVKSGKSGVRA